MTQTNLLPCPFCSGIATIKTVQNWFWCRCESCDSETGGADSQDEAIKQWNNRHTPKRELVVNMPEKPKVLEHGNAAMHKRNESQ